MDPRADETESLVVNLVPKDEEIWPVDNVELQIPESQVRLGAGGDLQSRVQIGSKGLFNVGHKKITNISGIYHGSETTSFVGNKIFFSA